MVRRALSSLGVLLALLASGLTPTATAAGPTRTPDDFGTAFPGPIGTYGSNAEDTPDIGQVAAEDRPGADVGNKALRVEYDISAWGGFDHSLTAARDWSAHEGLSLWGKGSGQRAADPVRGRGRRSERRAGRAWAGYFADDTDGRKQVRTSFEDSVRRPDHQPAGAPSDGVLELTDMWGYAVNLPAAGTLEFDQVELYGVGGTRARVTTDRPVYTVDHGDTATVRVSVGATGDKPLAEPVTVDYGTGEGTARPGEDYAPVVGRQGDSGDITEGTTILEGIRETAPDAEVTFSEGASAPAAARHHRSAGRPRRCGSRGSWGTAGLTGPEGDVRAPFPARARTVILYGHRWKRSHPRRPR